MTIEPGGGEGRVLAKCKLQEEEGGPEEGHQDGVDEQEGQPSLLDDHHGERPEGVQGYREGPAGEKVVRTSRPLLVLLQMVDDGDGCGGDGDALGGGGGSDINNVSGVDGGSVDIDGDGNDHCNCFTGTSNRV